MAGRKADLALLGYNDHDAFRRNPVAGTTKVMCGKVNVRSRQFTSIKMWLGSCDILLFLDPTPTKL